MRVLMIGTFPPRRCGIGDYTSDLVGALAEEPELDLTILTYDDGAIEEPTDGNRFEVVRRLGERTSRSRISHVLKELEPDLVHFQSSTFLHHPSLNKSVARINRIPLVTTVHDTPRSWRTFYAIPSLRRVYRRSSLILSHSGHVSEILQVFHRIQPEKLRQIPHGVDVDRFHPHATGGRVPTLRDIDGERIVLFFGFLRPGKGLETLLHAWKEVRGTINDAHLVVAGGTLTKSKRYALGLKREDEYPDRLRTLARDLGIQSSVAFPGYVPKEEVPGLLASANVFVLPYPECWSQSGPLHKALGSGAPIVASNLPAFAGLLEHGENALLTPPDNSTALAESITNLLENAAVAKELGKRARSIAEKNLSWSLLAKKTLSLYADCLANGVGS